MCKETCVVSEYEYRLCNLQGAKLFYLSGMVYGEYQTQEIKNLGRFISVMKFRPLVWQTSHPYVVADR